MSETAYCDVFVKSEKARHPSGMKWCAETMNMIDGKWCCPRHGVYVEAIKTLPYGSYSTLQEVAA